MAQLAKASNQPVPPSAPSSAVREASATILPPIQLYRRIHRAHRHLTADMRVLGDDYVRDEFRRHKDIDNPLQIVAFLSSWKMYLDQLEVSQGKPGGFRGKRLDATLMDKLSDEQVNQLYELMQATESAYDPERAQAAPPNAKAMAQAAAKAQGMSLKNDD
ncbi:probable Acetate non-utilizing protein 9, mitochondrial [Pseudozyma flocculosa]|uniref:Succinate dehydrogenase assembly factor 3 n=2 Tax=Pseudozyma flocculosa TaxID=84751 RepID=A0A5C3EWE5_9BASI|nr:probable Acetate non-utilizing protein 9, mitochondrial [Pseudozyma flocculosa]